jgi:glycosyltransferase involved in cell wall biosynthesis
MKIHFVINQDLFDGSAHALYCYRNCWWLATTAPPGTTVRLVFPGESFWTGRNETRRATEHFGQGNSPLEVVSLPALRRKKQTRGLTWNGWFHHQIRRYLLRKASEEDVCITASFLKLLRSQALAGKTRWVYEAHQLAVFDHGPGRKEAEERQILALARGLVTTTESLAAELRRSFPATTVVNLGLACGRLASAVPGMPNPGGEFTIGYLGSLYQGQGVDWLVREWDAIRASAGFAMRLVIAGGSENEISKLRQMASGQNFEFVGRLRQHEIPAFLGRVHALVIPAMNEGRMPHVAITKAYDYLAYERPVVAARLPSITEVMRPDQEALFFEAGNVKELSASLRTLASSPSLAGSIIASATHRAESLSWRSRSMAYWQFLSTLQQSRSSHSHS